MHVFFSQVRKRISVCHQPLAVRIPAHARTQWCAVVTEGCVPCLRASLKIQPNCEFLLLTPCIFILFTLGPYWTGEFCLLKVHAMSHPVFFFYLVSLVNKKK